MTLTTDRDAAPLKTLSDVRLKNIMWSRGRRDAGVGTDLSFFNDPAFRDNTRKAAKTVHPSPNGAYLVTSEPGPRFRRREYTLWLCRESGEIIRISELGEYPTIGRAHRHAKAIVDAEWNVRAKIAAESRARLRQVMEATARDSPLKYEPGKFNTSGEGAIYSPEYLSAKYGRDTA